MSAGPDAAASWGAAPATRAGWRAAEGPGAQAGPGKTGSICTVMHPSDFQCFLCARLWAPQR